MVGENAWPSGRADSRPSFQTKEDLPWVQERLFKVGTGRLLFALSKIICWATCSLAHQLFSACLLKQQWTITSRTTLHNDVRRIMSRHLCSLNRPFGQFDVFAGFNTYFHAIVTHLGHKICKFFFGSCNEVDIIREAYPFFHPSTANEALQSVWLCFLQEYCWKGMATRCNFNGRHRQLFETVWMCWACLL